jgi:2'-5' RNA ligase
VKATFALLANYEVHNVVRKLSWDIHQKYQTGIDITRLPPHISLKQPFEVLDFHLLEEYMTDLAGSITPFEVILTGLQLIDVTIEGLDTGILWLNVRETKILRQLHNRVNKELQSRFGDVHAAFDGPDYHFHMTVAIGGQPIEIYQKIYDEFNACLKDVRYTVQELVMFGYDERFTMNAGYMTYMILPIGK